MLSASQKREFAERGFLVVRNVVPEVMLAAADAEIDAVLTSDPPDPETTGKHFYFLPPVQLPRADAAFRDSGALDLAESLASAAPLEHAYGPIQIALNIPVWNHTPGGPHLDGYHDPERPHPFTMLAGVFLGDESTAGRGNLWVWPGSHLAHARLFSTHGTHALVASDGHWDMSRRDLGGPEPVLAQRGDLVMAHYLLGHNSGGNTSRATRRALYHRLSCAGRDDNWSSRLTDPFFDYPTIRPENRH